MSNQQTPSERRYILKHSMTVEPYDGGDLYIVDSEVILGSDECKHLFVEFDREILAQELNKNRIADEITGALEQGYDPTDAVWKVIEDSGVLGLLDPKGEQDG
jgi:hypothetical protein